VPDLAGRASAGLGQGVSEDLVWFTLGELGDRHLLEEPPDASLASLSMSRRDVIERLGVAATLTIGLIVSMPVASAQELSPVPTPPP
jgi:hypothetical protein